MGLQNNRSRDPAVSLGLNACAGAVASLSPDAPAGLLWGIRGWRVSSECMDLGGGGSQHASEMTSRPGPGRLFSNSARVFSPPHPPHPPAPLGPECFRPYPVLRSWLFSLPPFKEVFEYRVTWVGHFLFKNNSAYF